MRPELKALLPAGIAYAELAADGPFEPLFAEEAAHVARAVDKRKREFAVGRSCARKALAALGIPAQPLLPNPNRSVRWPSQAWGSVTHTDGFCAAIAGLRREVRGLGIDAEVRARVHDKLWSHIASAREIAWFQSAPSAREASERATLLFSAKEAFYKAQFCVSEAFVGFHEVELVFDFDHGAARAEQGAQGSFMVSVISDIAQAFAAGSELHGRFVVSGEHVITAMVLR